LCGLDSPTLFSFFAGPEMNQKKLFKEAQKLVRQLTSNQKKLVLAESCTGGMIASFLTRIPGVSNYFCGSFVVYRDASKQKWLQIPAQDMIKNKAESSRVAAKMAFAALQFTPEADISAAITGHLGPTVLLKNEGLVYVALAMRGSEKILVQNFQLLPSQKAADEKLRHKRQLMASHVVLSMVRSLLN
jgi:nicotinamide-nucleotide amidase